MKEIDLLFGKIIFFKDKTWELRFFVTDSFSEHYKAHIEKDVNDNYRH